MNKLINFCLYATEEDFFKYLMLNVAVNKQEEELKNLIKKYEQGIQQNT